MYMYNVYVYVYVYVYLRGGGRKVGGGISQQLFAFILF